MKREIPLFVIDTKKSHKRGECDFLVCTDKESGFVARIDYIKGEPSSIGDDYIIGHQRGDLAIKLSVKRVIGTNPSANHIRTLMKKGLDYYAEAVTLEVGATEITTRQCVEFLEKLRDGNKHYLQEVGADYNELQTIKTSLMMLDAIIHKLVTI